MTHLLGQPQYPTGPDAVGQPSHEVILRAHSAPKLTGALHAQGLQFTAPAKPAKKKPNKNLSGALSSTQGAAIMPDTDPWGRLRRKLMGLEPDLD